MTAKHYPTLYLHKNGYWIELDIGNYFMTNLPQINLWLDAKSWEDWTVIGLAHFSKSNQLTSIRIYFGIAFSSKNLSAHFNTLFWKCMHVSRQTWINEVMKMLD